MLNASYLHVYLILCGKVNLFVFWAKVIISEHAVHFSRIFSLDISNATPIVYNCTLHIYAFL